MQYYKKMCVLRQIKQGFSGDGHPLSGLIKAEQYGKNLAVEISIVGFAPLFWGGFSWTVLQCTTCALTGAVAELLMEIAFSPIGYRITKKWRAENVGKAYLEYREKGEVQ